MGIQSARIFFFLCPCPPPLHKNLLSNILGVSHRFLMTLIYPVSVEYSSHSFFSLSSSEIYPQKPVKYHISRPKLFTFLHYVLWTRNSLWNSSLGVREITIITSDSSKRSMASLSQHHRYYNGSSLGMYS